MDVLVMALGELQTNMYLIRDRTTKNCVILDPGAEDKRIITEIEAQGLCVKAILITHAHFDHIGVVDTLKDYFNVSVYAHPKEAEAMADRMRNLSFNFSQIPVIAHTDHFVHDGDVLDFGECLIFKCIEVPGHSTNSICYYSEDSEGHKHLFSGDTLFQGAIGRTDFYDGSESTLIDTIQAKLMVLDEDTQVHPGHGNSTTIKIEKESNPYVIGYKR